MAEPFASVRGGDWVTPSTRIVTVPVGVAVLEADPEATVIAIASLAPEAGVLLAAESVVFDATGVGAVTLTVSEPLEAA